MLVVCNKRGVNGFTYGRLYVFMFYTDLLNSDYTFLRNDRNIVVSQPKNCFKSITDWKKVISNRKEAVAALMRSEHYE
jgi:hypothetical protein